MKVSEIRKKIDQIDTQIVDLIIERMKCLESIAKIKAESGTPVFDPDRENEIIRRIEKLAADKSQYVVPVFQTILESSKFFQNNYLLFFAEEK